MKTCRNFYETPWYIGDEVSLRQRYFFSCDETIDGVSSVWYDIYTNNPRRKVGQIDLRLTMNENMFYYGHVGYHIQERYRGNHYALKACKLLFIIAKETFLMDELILTCNPDNYASRKTIIKAGAKYEGIVKVPFDHELNYRDGETQKCIYRIIL